MLLVAMDNEDIFNAIQELDGCGLVITDDVLLRESLELPPEKEDEEDDG